MRPAIFIDKDGTLIEDVPYNVEPERIRLLPSAAAGLRLLCSAGFALVIVSNQPGVGLGYFSERDLTGVEACLRELLGRQDIPLAGFHYCPHRPQDRCACRKPEPGLIRQAALVHRLDLDRSWMIGDILDDIEAGTRAGCRSVLIDNGHETEWLSSEWRVPDFRTQDLFRAACAIVAEGIPGEKP